ncbi:MAG: DUF1232 domain-containing protein [Phycisphaerales bacterium]|nr:DUF1232 domain-containing protein [Phycisphaerales bacterium]
MAEFFSFLKLFVGCSTLLFLAMLILLALPQSKLRAVGLELTKYATAAGLVLMCVSPLDVVPDVVPVLGFADDIAYIIGAIAAVRSGLGEREKRKLYDEIELQELRDKAGRN